MFFASPYTFHAITHQTRPGECGKQTKHHITRLLLRHSVHVGYIMWRVCILLTGWHRDGEFSGVW